MAAETNSTSPLAVIKWHDYTTNGRVDHILSVSGQPIDREALVEIVRRAVGYRLVDQMPAEGLAELCTTIGEMLMFYRSRLSASRTALGQHPTIKVRTLPSVEQPAFVIDED